MDEVNDFRTYYEKMPAEELVKEHVKLVKEVKGDDSLSHNSAKNHLAAMERVMIMRGMVFSFTTTDNVTEYDLRKGRGLISQLEIGTTDSSPVTTISADKLVTESATTFYEKWLKSPVSKADHPEWS